MPYVHLGIRVGDDEPTSTRCPCSRRGLPPPSAGARGRRPYRRQPTPEPEPGRRPAPSPPISSSAAARACSPGDASGAPSGRAGLTRRPTSPSRAGVAARSAPRATRIGRDRQVAAAVGRVATRAAELEPRGAAGDRWAASPPAEPGRTGHGGRRRQLRQRPPSGRRWWRARRTVDTASPGRRESRLGREDPRGRDDPVPESAPAGLGSSRSRAWCAGAARPCCGACSASQGTRKATPYDWRP